MRPINVEVIYLGGGTLLRMFSNPKLLWFREDESSLPSRIMQRIILINISLNRQTNIICRCLFGNRKTGTYRNQSVPTGRSCDRCILEQRQTYRKPETFAFLDPLAAFDSADRAVPWRCIWINCVGEIHFSISIVMFGQPGVKSVPMVIFLSRYLENVLIVTVIIRVRLPPTVYLWWLWEPSYSPVMSLIVLFSVIRLCSSLHIEPNIQNIWRFRFQDYSSFSVCAIGNLFGCLQNLFAVAGFLHIGLQLPRLFVFSCLFGLS